MPPLLPPDPPLADHRVSLRAWEDADVPWIAAASRDPLVPRWTSVPPENTEANVRAFLLGQPALRARGVEIHLLAVERASGGRIGPVGLHHVEWATRTAEVGYWTAAGLRGRGLTTAAVRLVCAWALGPLGFARLELRAGVENPASLRVAEKCGFVRERIAPAHERDDPGPTVVHALTSR